MAMTLITGRANAGKTGRIYDLLEATVRSGGRAVLLVPSQPELGRAVEEFARRRTLGLSIVTFEGWLAELWSSHGDGRKIVSDSARFLPQKKPCRVPESFETGSRTRQQDCLVWWPNWVAGPPVASLVRVWRWGAC